MHRVFLLSTQPIKAVPSLQAARLFCLVVFGFVLVGLLGVLGWFCFVGPVTGCAECQLGEISGEPFTTRGHRPFNSLSRNEFLLCPCEDSFVLPWKAGVRLAGCTTYAS